MLIPIDISSADLVSQYNMSQEEVENVIDFTIKEITAAFAARWEEQAKLNLHSTRQRYIENLNVIDEGRMSGAVVLDYSKDKLIRMIEEGCSAFDMKQNFEKSDSVKYNKQGGWYLTIPLQFGAPDTIGDSLGGITNLPQKVQAVIKKKPIDELTGRTKGLSSNEIPEEYKAPKTRAKIEIPKSQAFEAYTHKSSIYQGAYRQKDKVTGQSSYGSFRRVGENSDAGAFIYPGLTEANLAGHVLNELEQNMQIELTAALDSALSNFGFE